MNESAACRFVETRELAGWQVAHEQLRRLAQTRAGLDFEEGRWLVAALRGGVHLRLGYGSFAEYVGRLFGYGARLVQEKLRVAETLEGLPRLSAALKDGKVCWSMVRELTRVVTPETEAEWLAATQDRTVREVERLVSGHGVGDRPGDARDAKLERHLLRFEVTGEVLASFREALAKLRRDANEALDDEATLLLMARCVLEGPRDEGRASYQVALTVCEQCRHATQQGQGEQVAVGAEVVEMACCDAQQLARLDSGPHVGASSPLRATAVRATQAIAPAVRRSVLRRDGGRCVVPGCRHATWLDVHHLETRADGGQHGADNLVTMCGAHHRAIHRGSLQVERRPGIGLTFLHADGSNYGAVLSAAGAEANAKAFRALRSLGFSEREVRQALSQNDHGGVDVTVEGLVRACLRRLTERSASDATGQRGTPA